jgi:hypothetical protein
MPAQRIIVFVHGWSVHTTKTYGDLPSRLEFEARNNIGLDLDVREIWLSKYISFKDEVRLDDISRAFDAALHKELGEALRAGRKFICVTHSTGGPVARNWLDTYYVTPNRIFDCPMSHLIMLAPANFGSALAQLGKTRISRLKSWSQGIEPGKGVLDWLELGSPESWDLNSRWIDFSPRLITEGPLFPFVITGQSIDRAFYDHLNSYTAELGSDGVVRMAAANLNATYLKLVQGTKPKAFTIESMKQSAPTAFCIAKGCAHTGKDKGIMESVYNDGNKHATLDAILACLKVTDAASYASLCKTFALQNQLVRMEELVERDNVLLLPDHLFIHDPHAMAIFRIQDDKGLTIGGFDLKLTAGEDNSPNQLPQDFLIDRQRNSRHDGTLTFYFNYASMRGSPRVVNPQSKKVIRNSLSGTPSLGFIIEPHLTKGFVHFSPCGIKANAEQMNMIIQKDQTVLIDIVMKRIVREGVYRLTKRKTAEEFKDSDPGEPLE